MSFTAKHPGKCESGCGNRINRGDEVIQKRILGTLHKACFMERIANGDGEGNGDGAKAGVDTEARGQIATLGTRLRHLDDRIKTLTPEKSIVVIKQHKKPDIEVETAHKQFPLLLSLISSRENVYLWGAPGGGKSHACSQAAEALGLRYGFISLNEQSPEYLILGYCDATGTYRRSQFRDFYENGGVFNIEELDNAAGSLLTALNVALENGIASFPDGTVKRHPDFVMVGCGNTSGRGAHPAFPERRPFDAAFADRFFYVRWEYDPALESKIAIQINAASKPYIDWVSQARTWCEANGVRIILSPRASFRLARLSTNPTMTDADLLDGVLKGIDDVAKAKLLSNHAFPEVRR